MRPSRADAESGRVVVIGDALIDEMRDADGSRDFVGGAALNVAVGLAVLGVPTTLLAMVGDDDAGRMIRDHLADHGVQLISSDAPLGSARAVSDRTDGEPRYEFNDSARARRFPLDGAAATAIDTAPIVVVSCFPFDDADHVEDLIAAVGNAERRVIVDPNPRAGMMRDRAAFLANFTRFAAGSLLAKVGDEDAELLLGDSVDAFARRLIDAGASSVLATAGSRGAEVRLPDGESVAVGIATLPGPVVDTMGAGDATLAATVRRVVRTGLPSTTTQWRELLDDAMLVAAATCRAEGALLRLPPSAS
ncbi:MAG: PfkB family carbohydrate kinase [Leifsonia sp.]